MEHEIGVWPDKKPNDGDWICAQTLNGLRAAKYSGNGFIVWDSLRDGYDTLRPGDKWIKIPAEMCS